MGIFWKPSWYSFSLICIFGFFLLESLVPSFSESEQGRIDIFPTEDAGTVNPHVYGHFLEHIYHSVVDGLDGQKVRNRSFEESAAKGLWSIEGNVLRQDSPAENVHIEFGEAAWKDYEFSLEARKVAGAEGFLIIVRSPEPGNLYWWNLGGWGNREHALEAKHNERQSPAGRRRPGKIATGKWYQIKLRVEGDHIEGFLNGEKLLDVHDGRYSRGKVGVGTWRTQAEFRNFKVSSLDGLSLFAGLPELRREPVVAVSWEAYDEGKGKAVYSLDRENPLNSRVCQRIELSGEGWHGLQQRRFAVNSSETYRGSAFLRCLGFSGQALVKLLSASGDILSEADISGIGGQWKEFVFVLKAIRADQNASLVVCFRGGGTVWVDQVTLRSEGSIANGGFRPDLLEAVKGLRPTIIRWPGGCFAEWYRWRDSIGPQSKRTSFLNVIWGEMDDGGFGTDEFLRLCRAVGAQPLIVLNLGTHDDPSLAPQYLQEALDWIAYCNDDADTPMGRLRAANGHPQPYDVRFWELDNETWHMGVEAYAKRLKVFSDAIRKRFPTVKLFACGSGGFNEEWNRKLLELAAEHFDYLSIHHYENPDRFAEGPLAYETFWQKTREAIRSSANPNIKIAITEWNAQSTDWRTGLYAAGLLNAMERQCDAVAMASPALFIRQVTAPAWDNAFINHDHYRWFPAPNYVVMKLYREHFAPRVIRTQYSGPLSVVAGLTQDGKKLVVKVVNPTAEKAGVTVRIHEGFRPKEVTIFRLQADLRDRNSLEKPDEIVPQEEAAVNVGAEFQHVFPSHSATLLELVCDDTLVEGALAADRMNVTARSSLPAR